MFSIPTGKSLTLTDDLVKHPEINKFGSIYLTTQDVIKSFGNDMPDLEDNQVAFYKQKGDSQLETMKRIFLEQEIVKPLPKLYSYKVFEKLSAGTGYSYFGDGNYDTVFYDEQLDHDFASWVFGDSMEPTYLNGEVVLIKQTGFDYDGAIYAVD